MLLVYIIIFILIRNKNYYVIMNLEVTTIKYAYF